MDLQAMEKEIGQLKEQKERNRQLFACTLEWLGLLEEGKDLLPYFRVHQCKRIAIYGAAGLGKLLYKELQKADDMEVCFFMDRNAMENREEAGIPVFLPEEFEQAPEVDMVVVTAVSAYDAISRQLLRIRPQIPIVSISTIVEARACEEWQ